MGFSGTGTAGMIWVRAADQFFIATGRNGGYLGEQSFFACCTFPMCIMPRGFLLRNGKLGVKPVIYRDTLKPHNEISITEASCLLNRLPTGIK